MVDGSSPLKSRLLRTLNRSQAWATGNQKESDCFAPRWQTSNNAF